MLTAKDSETNLGEFEASRVMATGFRSLRPSEHTLVLLPRACGPVLGLLFSNGCPLLLSIISGWVI